MAVKLQPVNLYLDAINREIQVEKSKEQCDVNKLIGLLFGRQVANNLESSHAFRDFVLKLLEELQENTLKQKETLENPSVKHGKIASGVFSVLGGLGSGIGAGVGAGLPQGNFDNMADAVKATFKTLNSVQGGFNAAGTVANGVSQAAAQLNGIGETAQNASSKHLDSLAMQTRNILDDVKKASEGSEQAQKAAEQAIKDRQSREEAAMRAILSR